jgi:hypothetical protein
MDSGRATADAVARVTVIVQAIDQTLTDLVSRNGERLGEEVLVLLELRERLVTQRDDIESR